MRASYAVSSTARSQTRVTRYLRPTSTTLPWSSIPPTIRIRSAVPVSCEPNDRVIADREHAADITLEIGASGTRQQFDCPL